MIQNATLAERIDTLVLKILSLVFELLALALLLWAAFVVLVQCFGWVKSGSWQDVSVGMLFVSQETHNFIQSVGPAPNAIEFVPSWGSALQIEDVAVKMAGRMVGLQKICSWLLASSLVVWLVVAALAFFAVGRVTREEQ